MTSKKGRGWHKESKRHALAARGIKTGRKTASSKLRPETRRGAKTHEHLQMLSDMLWFNRGLLGPEVTKDIRKEIVEIQNVIGEFNRDSHGQLHPVRPGQRGLFMEEGWPPTRPKTSSDVDEARGIVGGVVSEAVGPDEPKKNIKTGRQDLEFSETVNKLHGLAKKYRPQISKEEVVWRAARNPTSFFIDLTGEIPLNPKTRKDSDKMAKLALEVER